MYMYADLRAGVIKNQKEAEAAAMYAKVAFYFFCG
jgi:hypothetical protein